MKNVTTFYCYKITLIEQTNNIYLITLIQITQAIIHKLKYSIVRVGTIITNNIVISACTAINHTQITKNMSHVSQRCCKKY